MAFNLGKEKKIVAEINVTPFVDVMLVLLVIFMITAPLMLNAVKLDLPKTREVNPINLTSKQVILSLTQSEELYLGKFPTKREILIEAIKKEFSRFETDTLFLRADFKLNYGIVAKLMSKLKHGGITKISLVTEIESRKK